MRSLITLAVLAAILAPFALLGEADKTSRVIHISLVEKNSVHAFYNRLASASGQVVATDRAVEGALDSIVVKETEDFRLFLVETFSDDAPLDGEIARFDHIAVVKVPQAYWMLHKFLGNHKRYGEVVQDRLIVAPQQTKSRHIVFNPNKDREFPVIDPEYLEEKLGEYSGATETTIDGEVVTISERSSSSGRTHARNWLRQEFAGLGFAVDEHDYGRGINFVAERSGTDTSRTLVISAHIDSVGNAGADDDGGGVILALAVAKSLSADDLAYNLRFIGFDEEERGLVGSAAYARALNGDGRLEDIVGVVNVEMPGYDADGDGAIHIIDCNENTSANLTAVFDAVLARESIDLVKEPACTNRSDHASFWRYNTPAIVISQNFFGGDSNPCYHRSCDRIDRVDFEYMRKITELVSIGVADMIVE